MTGLRFPVIDYEAADAPWEQLTAFLREAITTGLVEQGRAIPSKRYIHEATGLAYPTISKATGQLKREGLIEPRNGRGLFVTTKRP